MLQKDFGFFAFQNGICLSVIDAGILQFLQFVFHAVQLLPVRWVPVKAVLQFQKFALFLFAERLGFGFPAQGTDPFQELPAMFQKLFCGAGPVLFFKKSQCCFGLFGLLTELFIGALLQKGLGVCIG